MQSIYHFPGPPTALSNMTSFYAAVPNSSSVSEVSSASPSPVSCNTTAPSAASPGNAPRYGIVVPNRVFVGGIASNTTENELQELFSQFGNVKDIKIISDRGGVCKGYGFVTFETEEEAKKVQHQPDTIVLKERRLNIAPAVMKQQPFGRPYDAAPPTGALLYHNGTTYTYQNGMAFFTASNAGQSPYSLGASRETSMFAAPYGPGQSTPAPAYPQIMYSPYTPQPMPYLAAQQQYQYPMPFDYFKTIGPTASQYVYAPPSALNGALNSAINGGLGSSNHSPSPGYGHPTGPSGPASHNGPPSGPNGPGANAPPGTAFYHTGGDLYYNGGNHHAPVAHPHHQSLYPMESSPAHSEDWCPEPRLSHTPVVSLLKLHEEGSVEELEITRTPKKSNSQPPMYPSGSGGPRSQSRRPAPSQGRGRGPSNMSSLAGQRSASNPHLPTAPNSCLHRSTSLSPSAQVPPAYSGSRQQHHHHHHQQHQLQQQQQQHLHSSQQNQQGYHPRRGGNSMRNTGPKNYMGNARNSSSHSTTVIHSSSYMSGPGTTKRAASPKMPGEAVNGMKGQSLDASALTPPPSVVASNSSVKKQERSAVDEGGSGDGPGVHHALPLSPPNTPLPQGSAASSISAGAGGGDGDVCQKIQALVL